MPRKPKPPKPTSWNIYKAKKAVWLGTVEAPDKGAAIEKGAQKSEAPPYCRHANSAPSRSLIPLVPFRMSAPEVLDWPPPPLRRGSFYAGAGLCMRVVSK